MAKQIKVETQEQLNAVIEENKVTFGNPAYSKKAGDTFEITLTGVIEVRDFKDTEGKTTHPAYALSKNNFAVRLPFGANIEGIKDGAVRKVTIMETTINGRLVKYASFVD